MHKPLRTLTQEKTKQATDYEDSNDFLTPPASSSPLRPRLARQSRNTTRYLHSDFVPGPSNPAHPVEDETNNDSDEAIRHVLKGYRKVMVRRNPRWKSLKPFEIAAEELGRRWLCMSHEKRSTWHLTPTVRRVAWPPHTRLPPHEVIDKRGQITIEERFKLYPYAFDARGYLCTEYLERASGCQRTCVNAVAAGSSSLPLDTKPQTTSMALISTNDPDVCAARELVNAFEIKLAKARAKLAEYTHDVSVGPVDAARVADDETSLETGCLPFRHQKYDIPDLRNVHRVCPLRPENLNDKDETERTTRETDAKDEISEKLSTTSIIANELVEKTSERCDTLETEPSIAGPSSGRLEYNELVTRDQEEPKTKMPAAYKVSKKNRPLSEPTQLSITVGTQDQPIHEPSEIAGNPTQNCPNTEKRNEVSAIEKNITSPQVENPCCSGTERKAIRSKLWYPDAVTENDEANGATFSQDRLQTAVNGSNTANKADADLSNAQHEKRNQLEKQIEPAKMTENRNTNTSTTFQGCDQRHQQQRRRHKSAVIPASDSLDGDDGRSQAEKLAQEERLEKKNLRKEKKRLASERKILEEKEATRLKNKKIRKEERRRAAEWRAKEAQTAVEHSDKKKRRKEKRRLATQMQAQAVTQKNKGFEGEIPLAMEEVAESEPKLVHKKRKRDTEVQDKPVTPCAEEQPAQKKAKEKEFHLTEHFEVYDDGRVAGPIKEPEINRPNHTREPLPAQHTLYKQSHQAARMSMASLSTEMNDSRYERPLPDRPRFKHPASEHSIPQRSFHGQSRHEYPPHTNVGHSQTHDIHAGGNSQNAAWRSDQAMFHSSRTPAADKLRRQDRHGDSIVPHIRSVENKILGDSSGAQLSPLSRNPVHNRSDGRPGHAHEDPPGRTNSFGADPNASRCPLANATTNANSKQGRADHPGPRPFHQKARSTGGWHEPQRGNRRGRWSQVPLGHDSNLMNSELARVVKQAVEEALRAR